LQTWLRTFVLVHGKVFQSSVPRTNESCSRFWYILRLQSKNFSHHGVFNGAVFVHDMLSKVPSWLCAQVLENRTWYVCWWLYMQSEKSLFVWTFTRYKFFVRRPDASFNASCSQRQLKCSNVEPCYQWVSRLSTAHKWSRSIPRIVWPGSGWSKFYHCPQQKQNGVDWATETRRRLDVGYTDKTDYASAKDLEFAIVLEDSRKHSVRTQSDIQRVHLNHLQIANW
jgi:hypothetical protein